jgi:hypothetical protein
MSQRTFAPTFAPFRRNSAAKVGRNMGLSHLSLPFRRNGSGAKVLKENKGFLIYLYIYTLIYPPMPPHQRIRAREAVSAHEGVWGYIRSESPFSGRRPAA